MACCLGNKTTQPDELLEAFTNLPVHHIYLNISVSHTHSNVCKAIETSQHATYLSSVISTPPLSSPPQFLMRVLECMVPKKYLMM